MSKFWEKTLNATSILSLLIAIIMLMLGIRALFGRSVFVGLALFSMARNGTAMEFIGNILGIIIACGGFGLMGMHGLSSSNSSKQSGVIYGIIMTIICIISMICSMVIKSLGLGDILMVLLPVAYTIAVINTSE